MKNKKLILIVQDDLFYYDIPHVIQRNQDTYNVYLPENIAETLLTTKIIKEIQSFNRI